MNITLDLGSTVCIQQTLTGSGVFNGSRLGRASLSITDGSSHTVLVQATNYGASANSITVGIVDTGAGTVVSNTFVQFLSATSILVTLKRTSGAITATAADIVNAINGYLNANNPTQQLPIVASLVANGTWAAGVAAAPLVGGIDPTIVAPMFKFTAASTTNAGLFYFNQTQPMVVRQIECVFSTPGSSQTATISKANLDPGLSVISAETVVILSTAVTSSILNVAYVDTNIPLLPYQAILIGCPTVQGTCRVYARNEAAFPNL